MGLPFLRVYQSIVDRRIQAKRAVIELEKKILDLKLLLAKYP